MSSVRKVTVAVTMGDGSTYAVNAVDPSPTGGNPRFVTHQLASAFKVLHARAARILEADCGPQEPLPTPPVPNAGVIWKRLQPAITPEVPVSIVVEPSERRQSIGTTYRTDRDAVVLLEGLVPIVEALIAEATVGAKPIGYTSLAKALQAEFEGQSVDPQGILWESMAAAALTWIKEHP